MSNGKFHRQVGTVAGGAYALRRARHQTGANMLAETLGGALGGNLGARLPDIIDPPTHPGHRSIAHGMVPVGAAGVAAMRGLDDWLRKLRAEADRRRVSKEQATTTLAALWQAFLEFLCRVAAGAVAGVVAGYASHVALDATTPAGLPLFA